MAEVAAEPVEEIAVTIVPDEAVNLETAQADEVAKAEPDKAKTEITPADDPAKLDLKLQVEELRKNAQESERRTRLAEQDAARHRADAAESRQRETSSHLDTITTAISAAQQEAENAKQTYKAARLAGDIDAETEAADRLAIARADLRRLDEAKQDIEVRQKTPQRPREAPAASDPVEAYAKGRAEVTANWLRAHPDFVTDQSKNLKLNAAHFDAKAQGFMEDTPAYFEHVEKYLGLKAVASPAAQTEVKPKPRSAPPVAPGASVSGTGNGNGSNAPVTLTKREAEAAVDGTHTWFYNDPKGRFKKGDPIGIQEFARRKREMQKQGVYDRSFTEG